MEGAEKEPAARLKRGRQLLTGGALVMSAGVAIVGTVSASAGSWVLLAGWGILVYGLHVFGRAGGG